jgi:ribitol 2-dehydrogenase
MAISLNGKTALVTGAASGIGLKTAEALLQEGVKVVFADRNEAWLGDLEASYGPQAVPLWVDLLDAESCGSMIERALKRVDHLDILHCNAGSYIGGDLIDTTGEAIDRMLQLNVNAVMKNVHSVLPHMTERNTGDIIVTASKWAITCFVQTMRRQMFKHGVRVSQVSPGPVVSALLADWPEENLRKAKENGSLIEPEEVAESIIFMLTRPRNVTIRDMIVLPSSFDI